MTLKDQTIRAFLWVSSARMVSQTFSWLISILLARLLLPADFGLVALAWVVVGFLDLINELGIGAAIVQKKDLAPADSHTMFWLSLGAAIVFYGLTYGAAPWIALFFEKEALSSLVRVLALTVILGGMRTVPFNLLTKELVFSKRSVAEFCSVVAGGAVSVTLALSGHGVWSLAYGTLAQQVILTVLVFAFAGWRPRWMFAWERARGLLRFGTAIMSSRVLWYTYISSDAMIVGKLLGDKLLGYYSMAMQLSMLPMQKVTGIVNQVAFPVFSRLQDDREALKTYFLKITRSVALLTFPTMMGLFLVSDSLITTLLTDKWLPAVGIFKLLCVSGALKSIDAIIPNLLMAKGKPEAVVRYNIVCLLTLPPAFLVGSWFGLTGVGYAWIVTYPFVSAYLYRSGLGEAGISLGEYLGTLKPAVMASVIMAAGVMLFQTADLVWYGRNLYVTLIGACMVGAIVYLACIARFHRDVLDEVRDLFASVRPRAHVSRG